MTFMEVYIPVKKVTPMVNQALDTIWFPELIGETISSCENRLIDYLKLESSVLGVKTYKKMGYTIEKAIIQIKEEF